MGFRRASHAVYDCEYIIWYGVRNIVRNCSGKNICNKRAKELFREIDEEHEFIIEELEVAADLVHILVSFPPRYLISIRVKTLKSISVRKLFLGHPSLRKKYWKGEIWEDGYFSAFLESGQNCRKNCLTKIAFIFVCYANYLFQFNIYFSLKYGAIFAINFNVQIYSNE